tara:strand:+ start:1980 stop:2270 length:291 start_codon:yes stop_codon:yes gene_type:complete
MERIFNTLSVIKLLKDGLKKPNPANSKKKMWTLKQLDEPSPGWKDVVTECEGNPLFKKGYQGVKFTNLARTTMQEPKKIEEKVELTDPKDFQKYDF